VEAVDRSVCRGGDVQTRALCLDPGWSYNAYRVHTKKRALRLIVAALGGAALSIGIALAVGAGAGVASSTTSSERLNLTTMSGSTPTYPKNAAGETYGSAAGVVPSQEPELIEAVGISNSGDGYVTGYVRKSDLDADTGANVQNPQEAAAWTRSHVNGPAQTIGLYAQNGTTIIGHFTISAPSTSAPAPGER
jgi:hypothetical protein